MTVKMQVNTSEFTQMVNLAKNQTDFIQAEAYKFFRDHTPIRSGNARRHTSLKGDEIRAEYPYAGRLDEGYSRQAPAGMTAPTVKYIEQTLVPQAVGRINRGK